MKPLNTDLLKTGYIDREPPQKEDRPTGPYKQASRSVHCSLLIFVPRNPMSVMINDLTGRYGYSHLAVDCDEIDIPTGKPVMIESSIGHGVHTSFQDEYGERNFVRIPLDKTGVNMAEFSDCIHSKLGEKFDDAEALTIGLISDPNKQICSDLATNCLPETMRRAIARFQGTGLTYFLSNMWHSRVSHKKPRLFVTPNGYAKYFGAPKGEELTGPDQISKPVITKKRTLAAAAR